MQIFFIHFSEISNGGVLVKNNTKLCFMDTIKWTEVIYNNSRYDLSLLGSECVLDSFGNLVFQYKIFKYLQIFKISHDLIFQ